MIELYERAAEIALEVIIVALIIVMVLAVLGFIAWSAMEVA